MAPTFDALSLAELPPGGSCTRKHGGAQIALFRLADGAMHAVDNRCPHEGYPLSQGDISLTPEGPVLTCRWHNWRFKLADGACLIGGEDVRSYPVRIEGERVLVDLSPPDPVVEERRLWASLAVGLQEYDISRATRDAVRLLVLGVPPARIAAAAAAHDARFAEWGATHGLPVAADALRFLPRYPGPRAAIPLAQALDVAAYAHARRPARVLSPPQDPGPEPLAMAEELARRVEAEDTAGAEGLLRGALARGWGRAELEPAFFTAISAHHTSFGHRLIYQVKVFDLLDAANWEHAEEILCGHLYGLIQGTRDDVLPAWASARRALDSLDLQALWELPRSSDWDATSLRSALIDERPSGALQAMLDALQAGPPLDRLCDALSLAGAERMLRFDVAHDANPGLQDGWLSVTHIQTWSAALRAAVTRWQDPRLLRFFIHGAFFCSHHRVLDGPAPVSEPQPGSAAELVAAILARKPEEAMARVLARPEGFEEALEDLVLTDVSGAPIVQAHLIKTTLVCLDEARTMGEDRPLLALVRFLSSPVRQRWVHQGALEAIAFVTEGKVPRALAP